MRIRDIEAVTEIDARSFTLPWPRKAYQFELSENPVAHLWVAETVDAAGRPLVVGFIAIWLIVDEAHISTLATHPDFRGRGVASRLLQTALAYSIHRGARTATLEVRQSNLPAINLYRKLGFRFFGLRRGYYTDTKEDAWVMVKLLRRRR